MLFERVGQVLVLAHGAKDPSDAEWNEYAASFESCQRSEAPVSGLLVVTQGGAPNAGQRKAVIAIAALRPLTTCVCTNSMVARGVITALRWLSDAPMHGLRLDEIDTALRLLNVPAQAHADVKAVVARLQRQL